MKTSLPLLAALALSAGLTVAGVAADKPAADRSAVSVTFKDPDSFTDVHETGQLTTSTYYLDQLKACLQETAAPLLSPGQKLEVTVTDVDLAGDNVLNGSPDHIRIMKEIYAPRVHLSFRLLGADGAVLKQGTRHLTDTFYLHQLRLPPDQNEPLYYDKAMLRQWVRSEFKPKS